MPSSNERSSGSAVYGASTASRSASSASEALVCAGQNAAYFASTCCSTVGGGVGDGDELATGELTAVLLPGWSTCTRPEDRQPVAATAIARPMTTPGQGRRLCRRPAV